VQAIPPSARYFATPDCVHGYFQLVLDEESRDLTKFMLPSGRWQYLRGPIGLSATSDDWCRKSDFVIEGNKNARKIVDDILCWGATMQELMTKLDTILLRCKAIGITKRLHLLAMLSSRDQSGPALNAPSPSKSSQGRKTFMS
jgi:hypothetical protein